MNVNKCITLYIDIKNTPTPSSETKLENLPLNLVDRVKMELEDLNLNTKFMYFLKVENQGRFVFEILKEE